MRLARTLTIRLLAHSDIEDYRAIRLSALKTAPEAFSSVYTVEASKPLEAHAERLRSSFVFGAYDQDEIVGMIGFKRQDGPRKEHKGFLWGFYVEPDKRKYGVGSALISAVLEAARGTVEQVTLSVMEENAAAISLYESLGFRRYGTEPRALKDEGCYSNEVLMVLFLDEPSSMPSVAPGRGFGAL